VLVVGAAEVADCFRASGFAVEATESTDLNQHAAHSLDAIWVGEDVAVDLKDAYHVLQHGFIRVPAGDGRIAQLEGELNLERAGFEILERPRGMIAWTKLVTPKVCACAVLFDGSGRILLTERADGRGWCLPGGYAEADESPSETVQRETWEETGLRVSPGRLLGLYSVSLRSGRKIVVCTFESAVRGGRLSATDENTACRWFTEAGLPEHIFSTHRRRVEDAFAARRVPTRPTFVRDEIEP
jgi:8-oxo-dGTP diphosphatase